MRVLHVITCLATGGAERALVNVLSGGLAARFESAVVSLRNEGVHGEELRALGVPVHSLGMLPRAIPSPGSVRELRRVVAAFRPDVIQGWMYHGNLAATLAGRLAPGRMAVAWGIRQSLYDLHAERPLTRQIIRANRWLSRAPAGIIYNSRLSRDQHEAFGFSARRGQVIPNGFDVDRLSPDAGTGAAIRHGFGICESAPVVGHVARFHPMKDQASFLRAAVRLAREAPNVRFLVVGREVNLENPALAGIIPPDLADRFIFTGERSDVHELMQAMDLLCMSSWSEAFPNVLGEAMACAVPCVTTDVGDSADIVADTGIVVPCANSDALARGLLEMLGKSAADRRGLGQAGRERVEAHYGLDAVVTQYADLYETLAGGEGR